MCPSTFPSLHTPPSKPGSLLFFPAAVALLLLFCCSFQRRRVQRAATVRPPLVSLASASKFPHRMQDGNKNPGRSTLRMHPRPPRAGSEYLPTAAPDYTRPPYTKDGVLAGKSHRSVFSPPPRAYISARLRLRVAGSLCKKETSHEEAAGQGYISQGPYEDTARRISGMVSAPRPTTKNAMFPFTSAASYTLVPASNLIFTVLRLPFVLLCSLRVVLALRSGFFDSYDCTCGTTAATTAHDRSCAADHTSAAGSAGLRKGIDPRHHRATPTLRPDYASSAGLRKVN
ncbi:hypothetical protein B0H19DRAFT_1376264 [Mycena capillaripes]|nr:hypothetical protein B0H19DRAFT_1376264 [Mycena capillaripes]